MADTLGTIECTIDNCLTDRDGSLVIILRAKSDEKRSVEQLLDKVFSGLKKAIKRLKVTFAWHREKRSLNANAYFHVLVGKIAKETRLSDTEVKRQLVFDYGAQLGVLAIEREISPEKAGVEYAKPIDEVVMSTGKQGIQYMIYKRTSELDTDEMVRLIDGTVSEAQQLGIETKTPAELDKIKALWASAEE